MKINCFSCDQAVKEPGAIVISPPFKNNKDLTIHTVHKYHICLTCWENLIKSMEAMKEAKELKKHKR